MVISYQTCCSVASLLTGVIFLSHRFQINLASTNRCWYGCTVHRLTPARDEDWLLLALALHTSQKDFSTVQFLYISHTDPWLSQGAWLSASRFMPFC